MFCLTPRGFGGIIACVKWVLRVFEFGGLGLYQDNSTTTMKKTLITLGLAAAASSAMGATLHGIEFEAGTSPINSGTNPTTSNFYFSEETNPVLGYGPVNTIQGLWIQANAGYKMNASAGLNVTYLALDPSIKIAQSNNSEAGALNGSDGANFYVNMTGSGWVDINADYGTKITVNNMTGGTIYLNDSGALDLGSTTLNSSVTVDCTLTTSADTGYSILTRTLLTGDFSAWTGTVNVQGFTQLTEGELAADSSCAGMYTVSATTSGLVVSYVTPEPTTATLSLLALAGLCVRRRRK